MSPASREPEDDIDLVEDPDDNNIYLVKDPDCQRMAHGWMQNLIINKHVKSHHSGTNNMENRAIFFTTTQFFNIFSRQMSVISPGSEGVKGKKQHIYSYVLKISTLNL